MSSDTKQAKKKRQRAVLFQALTALVFLAMVSLSFGQNVLAPRENESIPGQLGDLKLVSQVEGDEALTQVNRLHGTDIKLVAAYIVDYVAENEKATVWIGKAATHDAASELLDRMVSGIAKGNPAFSNLQRLTVTGQEVFQVTGSSGKHFFYQSHEPGDKVIWLEIESADAESIMRQAVRIF